MRAAWLLLGALLGCGSDGFGAPTDVGFLFDGSAVVTDGYDNARVVRIEGDRLTRAWGSPGCDEGELDVPHGVAVDDDDRIYVADRSNGRVQIFDADGAVLDVWEGPDVGRPWGIAHRGGLIYVVDGGDQDPEAPYGRVTVHDRRGKVLAAFADGDEPVVDGHDIAVDARGAVYVGSLSGRVLRKFVPR